MARTYAGVLGPLAFAISLSRGLLAGGGIDSVLWAGWGCLIVFSVIGAVVGWIAETTVMESVNREIEKEVAGREAGQAEPPAKAARAAA